MSPSMRNILSVATGVGCLLALFGLALLRPALFGNTMYLGGILMVEVVLIALWHYETVVFPFMMLCFLWAGTSVPLTSVGRVVRWIVLATAAGHGLVLWLRRQEHKFTAFHFAALCCVAAAFASAAVSSVPQTTLLKAASLFLLFLYGATGARFAVAGREVKFLKGLMLACEAIVWISAVSYLVMGLELFGNPNSLGAVMAVIVTPILFWGLLIAETRSEKCRRVAALALAGGLLYESLSRASMLAATVVVIVLCATLRRHRVLLQGTVIVALFMTCAALVNPSHFDEFVESVTSKVLYKDKDKGGVLGSRRSPWQETVTSIQKHPLLGTGFGTSYMGEFSPAQDPEAYSVRTKVGTNREHGNSYLALTEYVGLLGVVPFIFMFVLLARMIGRVCLWLWETANPYHCAVPFAMVLLAGLVHAFFEDWLIAVGYYLCVFFWTSAFLLSDMLPDRVRAPRISVVLTSLGERRQYGVAAPTR